MNAVLSVRVPPSALRDRKRERTRRALQEAAVEMFETRGYEATTVADIAAAAEVGTRTFFNYFASKEELLFPEPDERVSAAAHAVATRRPDERPVEVLLRALRAAGDNPGDHLGDNLASRIAVLRAKVSRTVPAVSGRAAHAQLAAQMEIAKHLRAAFRDELDEIEAAALVGAVVGAVSGALTALFAHPTGAQDPDRLHRQIGEVTNKVLAPWLTPHPGQTSGEAARAALSEPALSPTGTGESEAPRRDSPADLSARIRAAALDPAQPHGRPESTPPDNRPDPAPSHSRPVAAEARDLSADNQARRRADTPVDAETAVPLHPLDDEVGPHAFASGLTGVRDAVMRADDGSAADSSAADGRPADGSVVDGPSADGRAGAARPADSWTEGIRAGDDRTEDGGFGDVRTGRVRADGVSSEQDRADRAHSGGAEFVGGTDPHRTEARSAASSRSAVWQPAVVRPAAGSSDATGSSIRTEGSGRAVPGGAEDHADARTTGVSNALRLDGFRAAGRPAREVGSGAGVSGAAEGSVVDAVRHGDAGRGSLPPNVTWHESSRPVGASGPSVRSGEAERTGPSAAARLHDLAAAVRGSGSGASGSRDGVASPRDGASGSRDGAPGNGGAQSANPLRGDGKPGTAGTERQPAGDSAAPPVAPGRSDTGEFVAREHPAPLPPRPNIVVPAWRSRLHVNSSVFRPIAEASARLEYADAGKLYKEAVRTMRGNALGENGIDGAETTAVETAVTAESGVTVESSTGETELTEPGTAGPALDEPGPAATDEVLV